MTRHVFRWVHIQLALLLIVLLATLVMPPQVVLAVPGDLPVHGPPTISRTLFLQVLQNAGSSAVSEAGAIYDAGVAIGIDPAFALAVFKHESTYGTNMNWAGRSFNGSTYNWGNIKCGTHPRCQGEWRVYSSWLEGAQDFYALIRDLYIAQWGLTTVASIISQYASSSDNTNVQAYIQDVLASMDAWHTGQLAPDGSTTGGGIGSFFGFDLDKSVNAPMDAFKYDSYRQLAQLGWQVNGSNFQFVDMLIGLRSKVLTVFQPLFDTVGTTLLNLAQWVIVIALIIAGLALAIRPLHRLDVVDVRTAFKLAVVLPLLLPVAGSLYAFAEGWREEIASSMYTLFFADAKAATVLQPTTPPMPAEHRQMDTLAVFAPDQVERPALDLGAAFLWAAYPDLQTVETGLPVKFREHYFPNSTDDIKNTAAPERQAALDQAWSGVLRMGMGLVVSLLSVLDELLRAIWMLGTTVLSVAVLLTAMWTLFSPARRLLLVLAHELGTVFLLSMVFGAVQAFFVALVYHQANAGLPGNTVAAAILAVLVTALLLLVAVAVVGLGLLNSYQVVSDSTALTRRFHTVMGNRVRAEHAARAENASDAPATSTAQRALAYVSARRHGASRTWAGSYALSTARGVAPAADVLLALGKLPPDIEHAVFTGAVSTRGRLSGVRGRMAMRHQVADWTDQQRAQAHLPQLMGTLAGVRVAQHLSSQRAQARMLEQEHERLLREADWTAKIAARHQQRTQPAAPNGLQPGSPNGHPNP